MNPWIFVVGVIPVLILLLGIFAVIQARKQAEIRKIHPGYPEGHWQGIGLGAGIAIGAGIGTALQNVAIGIAIGLAIGAAIGANLEKSHADEIRPMVDEERQLRRQSTLFTVAILALGLIALVMTYFATK